MSRIGKKPITIPKGVTVTMLDGAVEVQGPKGKLRQPFPAGINFELADGSLLAKRSTDDCVIDRFSGAMKVNPRLPRCWCDTLRIALRIGRDAVRLRTRNRYLVARRHRGVGRISALLLEDLKLALRGRTSLRGLWQGLFTR